MKMTCEGIQAHLRAGGELDPVLEAHLDACLKCTEVAAQVEGLGADDGAGLTDLDAVLGAVERSLSKERGLRAWLADRSTRARSDLWLEVAPVDQVAMRKNDRLRPRALLDISEGEPRLLRYPASAGW